MTDDSSVFDVDPDAEFVWLNHDGGAPAAFPRGAVDAWKAKGWEPCEAPPDVDPAMAEHVPLPAASPLADTAAATEATTENDDDPEEMNSRG